MRTGVVALSAAVLLSAAALPSCGNIIRTETSGPGAGAGAAGHGGGAGDNGGGTSGGPHVCAAPFADCNGDPADACEADLETDPSHCGACEHDCLESACKSGACEPVVLASDLYFPNRLALDAARVYWTSADGKINALPLGGGSASAIAGGQVDPWDLDVDGAGVYWTNSGSDTVVSLPFGAQLPVLLADAGSPRAIRVHKGVVYYTDIYDKLSDKEHVVRIPLPGGPPQVIASATGAWAVAVDDERCYFTDGASDAVWSAPNGGGEVTMFASIVDPRDIEVDGDAVYVTGLEGTFRIPLAAGAPQKLVSGAGLGLAIDATHVFVGAADGRLLKVPKAGGGAVVLSRADLYPADIAVGDSDVYWVTRTLTGALLRTPK